jgi:hypothetical protein
MPSRSAKASREKRSKLATDLRLPLFDQPQIERSPMKMSWEDAMRNFAPVREQYMGEFDSPEKRLRDKNPERLSL